MSQSAEDEGATTAKERRELREAIVRTVRYNTGGPQPAGLRYNVLLSIRSRARDERHAVERAIQIAKDRNELLVWRDSEDRKRFAEPTADAGRAILEERGEEISVDSATGLIEAEIESDEPNQALIGAANGLVDELREESGEKSGSDAE